MPNYHSIAFDDIAEPDYADMLIATIPPGAATDPRQWAERLFGPSATPAWVRAAMAIRQAIVPLLGIRRAPRDIFSVSRVDGEEALISVDERHLDFRCAVGVDAASRLIRVTTVVRLKGWRGRLYFAPVQLAHPAVVHAMLKRAIAAERREGFAAREPAPPA